MNIPLVVSLHAKLMHTKWAPWSLTWSEVKLEEKKPEETCSVVICWWVGWWLVMWCAAASAVCQCLMFHAAILTQEPDFISISHRLWGHRFCSPFKCSTWTGHASCVCYIYIYIMFIFAQFEGRQRLFDQTSEIVSNWIELAWEVFVRCRCHYTQSPA